MPLPSTGLDVGLVGPSECCQQLASAMLRISFDRRQDPSIRDADGVKNRSAPQDAAIAALGRMLPDARDKRRRRVYTAESVQDLPENTRLDHIVLALSLDNHHDEAKTSRLLRQTFDQLQSSTSFLPQKCSIVLMLESRRIGTQHVESCLGGRKRKFVPPGVTVFVYCKHDGARSVARRLLQRAKLGTRHGSSSLITTSPLII